MTSRPTVNGKGSYDVIVPKFQKLIEGRGTKDYYLRGTFTRFHQDFAEDVKALASIGRNISVEPVVGKEEDPYALQEADLPALKAEYLSAWRSISGTTRKPTSSTSTWIWPRDPA